jgi:hypothetical protein
MTARFRSPLGRRLPSPAELEEGCEKLETERIEGDRSAAVSAEGGGELRGS